MRRERAKLERVSIATLEVLVNALEAKDPFSRGHSARVADLSAMIAAELGMSDEEVEVIRTAGRLHDIGKIGIREGVLAKQGPLTPAEYEHVKDHVVIGTQILAPLAHLRDGHQLRAQPPRALGRPGLSRRTEGRGDPARARASSAIAEIFDALTTSRPYQEKMPANFAVDRLRDLVGTAVDPAVFAGLESVIARGRPWSSSRTPPPPEHRGAVRWRNSCSLHRRLHRPRRRTGASLPNPLHHNILEPRSRHGQAASRHRRWSRTAPLPGAGAFRGRLPGGDRP